MKWKEADTPKKIVTAFTFANNDEWLPPGFIVGELEVRTLSHDQFLVDGVLVDETTITPIPDPTPELIRVLKQKSLEWTRHDRKLAKSRAREDDGFREKDIDKEFGVHWVHQGNRI